MCFVFIQSLILGLTLYLNQAIASDNRVVISSDGPVVIGGTITFKADLYLSDGSRPSGTFSYAWRDNAFVQHEYETEATRNTTSYWTISYPAPQYRLGSYRIELEVAERRGYIFWHNFGRDLIIIEVTDLLNGNVTLKQSNKTLDSEYVSSKSSTEMEIDLRKGDYDYVAAKATSISTFWFVDCGFFGQTTNFTFNYNFNQPNTTHVVEALVIASFDPPVTTTTIAPTTAAPSTSTTLNPNSTIVSSVTTLEKDKVTTGVTEISFNETVTPLGNNSFPFVCLNSSVVPPEPHKVYGYFSKNIQVRAPISNITVDGTPWLQPWDMLLLNVSCKGSGPFHKCLLISPGQYNVTGNETCEEMDELDSCSFPITHYFLDPGVYTIVVILQNDVSKQISPLTITIYKATTKPQLSVIIVPVSCSLVAVVLIVFGVGYYIQSRARFTVEVADFDFGQHNPEMEYKTFTERLRDSFNSALRPGVDRISVRPPYYGSMND